MVHGQTDRIRNLKKSYPLVCRACQDESIDYNTLHFDEYSRLTIGLNIFRFFAISLIRKRS